MVRKADLCFHLERRLILMDLRKVFCSVGYSLDDTETVGSEAGVKALTRSWRCLEVTSPLRPTGRFQPRVLRSPGCEDALS